MRLLFNNLKVLPFLAAFISFTTESTLSTEDVESYRSHSNTKQLMANEKTEAQCKIEYLQKIECPQHIEFLIESNNGDLQLYINAITSFQNAGTPTPTAEQIEKLVALEKQSIQPSSSRIKEPSGYNPN